MMSSKKWKQKIDKCMVDQEGQATMQEVASDARKIDYFLKNLSANHATTLLAELIRAIVTVNRLSAFNRTYTLSDEQRKKNISKLYQFGEKVPMKRLQNVIRQTGFDPRKSISRLTRIYWRVVNWFKARNMYHTDQVVHENPRPTKPIIQWPKKSNNSGSLESNNNNNDGSSVSSHTTTSTSEGAASTPKKHKAPVTLNSFCTSLPPSPIKPPSPLTHNVTPEKKENDTWSETSKVSSSNSSKLSSLDSSKLSSLDSSKDSSKLSSIRTDNDTGQMFSVSFFNEHTGNSGTTTQHHEGSTVDAVVWDAVFEAVTPRRCRQNQTTNSSKLSSINHDATTLSSSLSSIM